jgi:hypothetical protein
MYTRQNIFEFSQILHHHTPHKALRQEESGREFSAALPETKDYFLRKDMQSVH